MRATSHIRQSRSASRRRPRRIPRKHAADKIKDDTAQENVVVSTVVKPPANEGVKLSKNAIIELLETNIKKAHVCTQKTMLNFYYVILKLLSTLFTLWDNKVPVKASVPQQATVDSESSCATKPIVPKTLTTEKSSIESYQTRLEEKLAKIQKHKSRLNGEKLIQSAPSVSPATPTATPAPIASSSANDLTCSTASNLTSSAEKLFNSQPTSVIDKSKFKEYFLVLCVHAGLVVMYLQVVILGIALNTTIVPAGLIFMLVTLGIIGYIFVKVSLMGKHSVSSRSPKSSPVPKVKNARRSRDLIKDDFSPERQSRSKAKKIQLIELKYQTLSKVKLL